MAETLREPAVALSPDSGNFARNIRTTIKQIRKAGSGVAQQETAPFFPLSAPHNDAGRPVRADGGVGGPVQHARHRMHPLQDDCLSAFVQRGGNSF